MDTTTNENKSSRVEYTINNSLLTETLPRIVKHCVKAAIWGAVETLSFMAVFAFIIWKVGQAFEIFPE